MIQTIRTEKWNAAMHSKIHEQHIEHRHDQNNMSYVYLEVEFDEENAVGFLDLYPNHNYRLSAGIIKTENGKPATRFQRYSDGSISSTEKAQLDMEYIDLEEIAINKMIAEQTFTVNIDKEIADARAKNRIFSDEEIKNALQEGQERCDEYKRQYQKKIEEEKTEREAKQAKEEVKANEEKAKQAAEAEIKQKEMLAWAQEHGSDRLRKGLEHGHACKKLYETELGEHLIQDNGYEYDRENKIEEKDRSCPSLAALEEVERIEKIEGLSASVVWLPEGLTELHKDPEEYYEPESGCEAVKVDVKGTAGYWYKTF